MSVWGQFLKSPSQPTVYVRWEVDNAYIRSEKIIMVRMIE